MKPKWQRARIIGADINRDRAIGREVWTEIGSLHTDCTIGGDNRPCLRVAMTDGPFAVCLLTKHVELLARDENDFAESVPLVDMKEWLNERHD